jgi:hypothetical protein
MDAAGLPSMGGAKPIPGIGGMNDCGNRKKQLAANSWKTQKNGAGGMAGRCS